MSATILCSPAWPTCGTTSRRSLHDHSMPSPDFDRHLHQALYPAHQGFFSCIFKTQTDMPLHELTLSDELTKSTQEVFTESCWTQAANSMYGNIPGGGFTIHYRFGANCCPLLHIMRAVCIIIQPGYYQLRVSVYDYRERFTLVAKIGFLHCVIYRPRWCGKTHCVFCHNDYI